MGTDKGDELIGRGRPSCSTIKSIGIQYKGLYIKASLCKAPPSLLESSTRGFT
jgi:hypothetical protein